LLTKTSSRPPLPDEVRTAYGLLSANLLILPGLGTWVGGYRWRGAIQMILATIGLGLTLWGVGPFFLHYGRLAGDADLLLEMLARQMPMIGQGMGLFLAGWLWGLVEGLREVRRAQQERAG
jgi:hypothetical protein